MHSAVGVWTGVTVLRVWPGASRKTKGVGTGEVCFTIGCRCEDYRTKAIVAVANMPLGVPNYPYPG